MSGLHENGTVSNRHAAARSDADKLTAGQLAAKMRKVGLKVTAKELAEFATEWHHAGWNPRGGMGRCYFFRAADASPERMTALMARVEERRQEQSRPRFGFEVAFRRETGAYGKKRFQPIASLREFAAGEKMPEKFIEITAEEFAALKPHDGAELKPYESLSAFKTRIGVTGA